MTVLLREPCQTLLQLESSSPSSFPGSLAASCPAFRHCHVTKTLDGMRSKDTSARLRAASRALVEQRLRHGQSGLCQRQRHADTRDERRMRTCCRTLRPPPAPCWLRQGCQQAPMSRRRLSLAQRVPAAQPRPRRARADRQCVHTLATRPCPSKTTRASSKQETERLRFRKCSRVEERAVHRELHTFGLRPDSHRVRLSTCELVTQLMGAIA